MITAWYNLSLFYYSPWIFLNNMNLKIIFINDYNWHQWVSHYIKGQIKRNKTDIKTGSLDFNMLLSISFRQENDFLGCRWGILGKKMQFWLSNWAGCVHMSMWNLRVLETTAFEFVISQVTKNKIKFIKHFIHFTMILIIMTIYTDSKNSQTLPRLLLHKLPKYLERPYITKWIFFS